MTHLCVPIMFLALDQSNQIAQVAFCTPLADSSSTCSESDVAVCQRWTEIVDKKSVNFRKVRLGKVGGGGRVGPEQDGKTWKF